MSSKSKKRSAEEAFVAPTYTNGEAPQTHKRTLWQPPAPYKNHNLKARAEQLLTSRRNLPIYTQAPQIRQALRDHSVLLLVGETGSGKSTQVPQFLLQETWCQRQPIKSDNQVAPVGGCIAITQPRRVAAISLARRVAEEMGTPLGKSSPASQVGYSVRFDSSVSPSTRIKFLTEGMLLQEMLRDPWLTEYSAVVVDEVHERSLNVELVLGFLTKMLRGNMKGRGGVGLKVVVMSATADVVALENYFKIDSRLESGTNGRIGAPDMEDIKQDDEWTGFSDVHDMKNVNANLSHQIASQANGGDSVSRSLKPATLYIKGRQYPVKTVYTNSYIEDLPTAVTEKIFDIHKHQPLPGDILVFLSGQELIETVQRLCIDLTASIDPKSGIPKLLILPLFAALPQSQQQRVFERAPSRTRKVILSTNIAETSVTVPGIKYVIDSGKAKRKLFRPRLGLDSLLVKSISKSSANQRKGRAGRESEGTCYRLYTEQAYFGLEQDSEPEILRCDLSQLCLAIKARGVDDILSFPFLTPPPTEALRSAVLQLLQIGALSAEDGSITEVGRQIARLPLSTQLGRVLLAAASQEYDCLAEAIDVVSALSVETIFLPTLSEESKEQADHSRREVFRREGDHLTLLATVKAYVTENSDRKSWCEKRLISHRAMQDLLDVRKQLISQTKHLSTMGAGVHANGHSNVDLPERLLKAFLAGFGTNTAMLWPDGSYKTWQGKQVVAIHPSSVLFGRKVEAIMYNEFVYTTKAYARGVSAVQLDWVTSALGASA